MGTNLSNLLNRVHHSDCVAFMKTLPDNCIDSIVTDPPYELGFMGKSWDNTGIANSVEMRGECLRILKPGGHLLAFSGTRTYHRMAVAIEDAGFEVRDMIEWVYGSGFPKSLNIGKAVDKQDTVEFRKEIGLVIKKARNKNGLTMDGLCDAIGLNNEGHGGMVNHYENGRATPTVELWLKICEVLGVDAEIDYIKEKTERLKIIGETITNKTVYQNIGGKNESGKIDVTEPKSELGKQWEGWGTALKPAHEPVCMARKPLAEKTVAENCLKWGTGGINIDESRVGTEDSLGRKNNVNPYGSSRTWSVSNTPPQDNTENPPQGRFPANIITDGSEEVRECFPETKSGGGVKKKASGTAEGIFNINRIDGEYLNGDSGNASRFFKSILYYPKASKAERNKGCDELQLGEPPASARSKPAEGRSSALGEPRANNHPTVKPIALMEYLIKMVTREGGIVFDPFTGSGTTLVAAKKNGFQYLGTEMTDEYIPIIEARLNATELEEEEIIDKGWFG